MTEIYWAPVVVNRGGRCPSCRTPVKHNRTGKGINILTARTGAVFCGNCAVDGVDIIVGKIKNA